MTTGAESLSPWSSAEHVPIEELARRQGVQPVESLDDLACPELWDSDEEYERFLGPLRVSPVRLGVSYVVLDTDVASAILVDACLAPWRPG
jgi:hypothetical protein